MGKLSTILITILMGFSLSNWAIASSAGGEGNKSVQPKSYANQRNTTGCLGCHGQLDYLRSVVKDAKDGYGHPVSAETVAQGLYVAPEFVNDRIHGRQSCEFCHGGDPKATDAKKAHAGMTKNPTADGGKKLCASCHQKTVDNFQNSIHFKMSGVKAKLTDRMGNTPHKADVVGKIMAEDCLNCHATCGTCHVGQAPVANAGLQKNHRFIRRPDNLQVCIPCHHLAGAGFFTQEKNLHVSVGMDCVSCHNTAQQFHGRGGAEEPQGMMTPGLIEASCHNCHQQVDKSNDAHSMHTDFVSCQACHGTEYESCISCHRRTPDAEHIFKLGMFNGKVYPFVHTTGNISADMFAHMDIKLNQKDLEAKPTWAPYPTHFLQLTPKHKKGAEVMCENCHGNPELFLKDEDLTFPNLEKGFVMKAPAALSAKELDKYKKTRK
ncbi:multiheme c-type cytochrome [Geomonas oryzae]|uniref:multiheme c-type cytochrome n=1 Tax=Geomonas oryzae TaxID=2364273 RepID=UPI00100B21B4|nr:multiheme c-type cytochrome [Geomonas oryzae]